MPSSLTPPAKTYDEAVAEVANFVKVPASSGTKGYTLAQGKIKNAINWFNQRPWSFMLTKEDLTAAAGDVDLVMTATTMRAPLAAFYLDTSDKKTSRRLIYLPPDAFAEAQDLSLTGDGWPRYYTAHNISDDLTIYLDRAPSAGFASQYPKLRLRFHRLLQVPASGATKLDIPSYAEPALLWRAKYEIALDFDPDKAVLAERESLRAWALLEDREDELTDGLEGVDGLPESWSHWG